MIAQPTATFLRASKPYWLRTDIGPAFGALHRLNLPATPETGSSLKRISRDDLARLGISIEDHVSNYDIYHDEEIIAVGAHKAHILSNSAESEQILRSYGNERAQVYRSESKAKLIKALASRPPANTTESVLAAFCEYTRYNSYSAWLYNDITDVFTRIAGHFVGGANHISRQDCNMLATTLESPAIAKLAVNQNNWCPDPVSSKEAWCNAFSVSTDRTVSNADSVKVVVCFYSNYAHYDLRESTALLIRSFLQQDLADRYFDRLSGINRIRTKLRANPTVDKPSEYLHRARDLICEHLGWEACSIYLSNPSGETLRQVAPKSDSPQEYEISDKSLTSSVYREKRMQWSYDIARDPRNSHRKDDETVSPPRNWIGVPIMVPVGDVLGVLRVKNHRSANEDVDVNFSSLDMRNVEAIASEIAATLQQCDEYSAKKKVAEQRARELSELQDFLKTFRHEIRSPIQALCFAPERLGVILTELGIVDPANIPKRLKDFMVDFKATGYRLEMISKALTLDPDKIVKDIETKNIFKDCVAPVMSFMRPYAWKKRRRVHIDIDSLLVNIECDAVAVSMAFHVLVDNAIKYSDRNTLIRVYGERSGGGHQVVVESRSDIFTIDDNEVSRIREKYVRGRLAEEQKMDGSGIGLYLADRIMMLHKGQLVLLNHKTPVRFALRFGGEKIL